MPTSLLTRARRIQFAAASLCASILGAPVTLLGAGPAQAADALTWRHCMQLRDPSLSSTACSAIIDAGKETPENAAYAYLYRGRAGAFCHRTDQAASDFQDAIKRDPTLVHAWYGLGQLAMAAKDYAGAAAAFDKAVDANGEDADVDRFASDAPGVFRYEVLRARGYASYKREDLARALTDYNAAIETCPTCSATYRDRGIVFARQHKLDAAFADFNRAIQLNPRGFQGFFIRGYIFSRMSRFADAIANYTEALRLSPKSKTVLRARADAYASLGKSAEAEADRKQADSAEAEVKDDVRAACGRGGADFDPAEAQEEADAAAPSADPSALDDAALGALFAGKSWQAKQGLWSVGMEFRRDGAFVQRARDDTQGGKLQVTTDGAWFAAQGRLCLYTNAILCLDAHKANGTVTLARADGTAEYVGAEAKLQALDADNASAPIAASPLDEQFHAAPAGAATGPKTLFYYIHGLPISPRLHNPFEPYFVAEIRKAEGWDVIDADFPLKVEGQYHVRGTAGTFSAAAFVAKRLKELKAKGYRRIYVGGQFMGGWVALALSTQAKLPLDGLLMIAPTCCSAKTAYETGKPASDFLDNKLYFEQLIARDLYPTTAVFFAGDEYDPGGRGEAAGKTLTQNGVANLIVDQPEGFSGEGSMSLPVFDYLYRGCIVDFLNAPKTMKCAPPDLGKPEFRTVFGSDQLPDLASRRIDPANLIGKKFASYPSGETYKIASADSTVLQGEEAGERNVPSVIRGGQYCLTQKVRYQRPEDTGQQCYVFVRWSDREVLAFDAEGKQVLQWWVANGE